MSTTRYEESKSQDLEILTQMPSSDSRCLEMLSEIFSLQVFEIHLLSAETGTVNGYIPYMMNDASECFLILEHCRIKGRFLPDMGGRISGRLAFSGQGYVLIIHQGEDNVFTLWFQGMRQELQYYQYHEIGHFWVTGQEQWRQLVYIVGTIYDKYQYLGEDSCNEEEKELFRLMEFSPFRSWSPIRESLEETYPETREGLLCMKKLAEASGDRRFVRMLKLYEHFPNRAVASLLKGRMQEPSRAGLYQWIWKKVQAASEKYEKRDYGPEKNQEIRQLRERVENTLRKHGFQGEYPYFFRPEMQILAAEEHPFTILEAENFRFHISFMVSEGKHLKKRNEGFFRGGKGWIARDLDFLGGE